MTSVSGIASDSLSAPTRWYRFWRDSAFQTALVVFIIARVITLLVGVLGAQEGTVRPEVQAREVISIRDHVLTAGQPLRQIIAPWYRWDTNWYLWIAYKGYTPNHPSIIFAPLFPWATRITALLTGGDYLLAGLLVSSVACLVALTMLFKLAKLEFGKGQRGMAIARQTVITLMCYPLAFYFMAAYTEALFLALTLGAWLAVRREHYLLAALLGFCAALTRSQGWSLSVCFAVIIFIETGHTGTGVSDIGWHVWNWPGRALSRLIMLWRVAETRRRILPIMLAILAPIIGAAVYLVGFEVIGLGDIGRVFAGPAWEIRLAAPWVSVINAVGMISSGRMNWTGWLSIATFCAVVIGNIAVTAKLKPSYAIYCWITLLFVMLRNYETTLNILEPFHGLTRYFILFFPIFLLFGKHLSRQTKTGRVLSTVYIIAGIMAQIALLTLFVQRVWVS